MKEKTADTKKTRGGLREGSGAHQKYGEPTVTISKRVPESHAEQINKMLEDYLAPLVKN